MQMEFANSVDPDQTAPEEEQSYLGLPSCSALSVPIFRFYGTGVTLV